MKLHKHKGRIQRRGASSRGEGFGAGSTKGTWGGGGKKGGEA